MHPPDEKQRAASATPGDDEALPLAWRRLLAAPKPAAADEHGVLGFFLEVMPEEGAAFVRLEVAPVLLGVAEHGRYVRPVPLDSRHLAQSPLQPHEQRLPPPCSACRKARARDAATHDWVATWATP